MNQLTNLSSATLSAQHEQDAKDLTRILPASQKIYVQGSRPDIQVPFRAISLTDTPTGLGGEINPSIMVYDTSGVYTDPTVTIDLNQGLPKLRDAAPLAGVLPHHPAQHCARHRRGLVAGFHAVV